MTPREILSSSATSLARAIRTRELSSRAAVEAHIARIRRVNPELNAVVRDRFDDALTEATRADERVSGSHPDELPPFHGVPCTIKESFAVSGMPHTSGLWARRDVVAGEDATAVRRLRDAGAIVLGVTNVSELCMWMESSNKVWGRTNNPYDLRRTPGGSSGGEGAIVGAGASPFGLGADVGGSIRMPAFFSGVFGHKPTGGLVPGTGQHPEGHGDARRYVTSGPLARRAEDLMPLMRVLAGPDGVDDCISLALGDPSAVDLGKLTVVSIEENGVLSVERALVDAQRRAAAALEARGARVVVTKLPALKRSLEIWSTMLHEGSRGGPSFREMMAHGGPFDPWRELLRYPLGRSRYTLPGLLLSVLEEIPNRFGGRTEAVIELGAALRRELDELLGDSGVMLFPSHPKVAPRHHDSLLVPIRWMYTAIFAVLELPVTQVPLGLDARALPLGVQVVGAHGNDHLTIAVAEALERSFGGWKPPPRAPLD